MIVFFVVLGLSGVIIWHFRQLLRHRKAREMRFLAHVREAHRLLQRLDIACRRQGRNQEGTTEVNLATFIADANALAAQFEAEAEVLRKATRRRRPFRSIIEPDGPRPLNARTEWRHR